MAGKNRPSLQTHRQRSTAQRRVDRFRAAEAQNWRCAFCHTGLEPETATTEHVLPLALGGWDAWENIVAACLACNRLLGRYLNEVVLRSRVS